MMRQVMTGLGIVLALAMAAPVAAQNIQALTGATVIDGTGGPVIEGAVVIEGGRIACVGDCEVPRGAMIHDFSGSYITPGLVDAHVHFAQTGWIDGRPDGIEAPDVYPYDETIAALRADPGRWHRAYLCSGTTAVFDVGGASWTVTGPHATDTDRPDRTHVRAAGPLITHASARNRFFLRGDYDDPMFLPMDSDAEVREGVAHLKTIGSAAVKVWYLRPPPERRAELDNRLMLVGRLAREAGLPLIVHATGLREAKQALKAGAKMLVHSVEDQSVDQEFLNLLRANDAVYAPTLVVGRGWRRAVASVVFEKPVEVDDPGRCVDEAILDRINHPERLRPALGARADVSAAMTRLEDVGRRMEIMFANLRTVSGAGGHVVVATDAGNPLTVHGPSIYWEMEVMQQAGLAPEDIITAATLRGAVAMGIDRETGSVAPGKMADLIILEKDPRENVANFRSLTHVMRKGMLRTQKDLQAR